MIDWHTVIGPDMPLLETVVRGTIMYFVLLLLIRLSKREAGSLGLSDMLVVVVIADAAQNGMSGPYMSVMNGIVLVATIIFWDYAIDWLTYNVPILDKWTKPKTVCLVRNGRILAHTMRSEMITREELWEQLRLEGIDDLKRVKHAYMESNGKISIIKTKD